LYIYKRLPELSDKTGGLGFFFDFTESIVSSAEDRSEFTCVLVALSWASLSDAKN